ncbi:MAG: tetratricopeptide repeat protein [Chthoniobacterales bacterium]
MAKKSKKLSPKAKDTPPKLQAPSCKTLLQGSILVITVLIVFSPVFRSAWFWDDVKLVTDNLTLRSLQGLWDIWFTKPVTDYWPISWSFLWLEWQLWGLQPLGFHICNLALHLLSAFLIWRLFKKLGFRWGWVGALLFAIHPLTVESTVWISEIKNTLSLPFFLLSFTDYIESDGSKGGRHYIRSILFFLVAMLCKTSVVMLPIVLLLYCWWKRNRISQKDILKTAPYFGISLILGLVTVYFQNSRVPGMSVLMTGGFLERLAGAGSAIFFYLWKFLVPTGLLVMYPHWKLDPPTPAQLATIPVLIILLLTLWSQRNKWGRHVLFGFGFFLLTLLPVLGFVSMGYMDISLVADHLVYLPMIGIVGLSTLGLETAHRKLSTSLRPIFIGGMIIVGTLLAWQSHWYASLFIHQKTLWIYTLERNPDAWMAHNNLGIEYASEPGGNSLAIAEYEKALSINPNNAHAHNNLGNALAKTPARISEAVAEFEKALSIDPNNAATHKNLGNALVKIPNRLPDAITEFQTSLRFAPNDQTTHYNLALALTQADRTPEAIVEYKATLQLNSDDSTAHYNLGVLLANTPGQMPQAINEFEEVVRLNPNDAEAHYNLGIALVHDSKRHEAISHFEAALRINPKLEAAREMLSQIQNEQ